jgi:hypothetical protein
MVVGDWLLAIGTNDLSPIPRISGQISRRGAGDSDGRGSLRGCASTQAPVPGEETAKVGGGVRGPITHNQFSLNLNLNHNLPL